MKEAYDQFGDEFAASSSVFVADCDCTADCQSLCEEYNVGGYPTLKYFVDGDTAGQDYQGSRDAQSLIAFGHDVLELKCELDKANDTCTEKEQGYIEKMKAASSDDIDKQITRLQGMQGKSMAPNLQEWLNQRLHILKMLQKQHQDGSGDEL